MLSQEALRSVTSDNSSLSLVLFDEIEKAAGSMTRMMLGLLDKGKVRLGDNTATNFESSFVCMTSNLGSREIVDNISPFGLELAISSGPVPHDRIQTIGIAALKKKFSPEFINRIDKVLVYRSLDRIQCKTILEHIIAGFQDLILSRLGMRSFTINYSGIAKEALLDQGVSQEYGARELKRLFQRVVTQPVAALVAQGMIKPGAVVMVDLNQKGEFCLMCRD